MNRRIVSLVGASTILAASVAQAIPPFIRGMGQPAIAVQFSDSAVQISSLLDVSNVALQYSDGSLQRFENLQGRQVTIAGVGPNYGKQIMRAWVKAGPNLSGNGPDLGERFERPALVESEAAPNRKPAKQSYSATMRNR